MSADYQFGRWLSSPPPGKEVVITGISGRFPESNNVRQLQEHLFDQLNITTQDNRRWDVNLPGVPKKFGKINDIEKFDCGFFGVHHRQADAMSPMIRKSLEITVEAVLDAGINLSELQGSKTGVFSATAPVFSDVLVLSNSKKQKFRITGCSTADISHRISYFLKLKGPSFGVEMDCSGSFIALDIAIASLRLGKCDNAIVVACNLLQHPKVSRELAQIGILSPEGVSRVFDEDANGYVRSEAIACIFLQRAESSRRIYAKISHIRIGFDGYKLEGITVPSAQMQTELIQTTLSQSGIEPSDISYVEAHGTGTKIGDPHEANSIDTAIAKNRQTPLLIGAIKNNIGHTEASSGLCSIVKAIIAMEAGFIPPTINVKHLKKGIEGFEKNRLKVVTKTEKLPEDGYIGINCFGWGGGITHLILQGCDKKKINDELAHTNFPRLVLVSGRTRETVQDLLDDVSAQPNEDYLSLLQQVFKEDINGNLYRGFSILEKDGPTETSVKFYKQSSPPLFVFFGPLERGFELLERHLLKVPIFKSSTQRIFQCLLEQRPTFDTALSLKTETTVTAFAIQLGVVEVLKSLKIELTPISDDLLHDLIILYYNKKIDLEETITKAYKVVTIDGCKKDNFRCGASVPKNSIVLNVSDSSFRDRNQDLVLRNNFFQILGRLYQEGYNPQMHKLSSIVQFPVRRKTTMISPLVKWNHDKHWYTYTFSENQEPTKLQNVYDISYEEFNYLEGHHINGIGTLPASEVLRLVCLTFKPWLNTAIVFENCELLEPIIMPKNGNVKLFVSIFLGSGNFEVCKDNILVASGRIFVPEDIKMYQTDIPLITWCDKDTVETLTHEEIYRELNLKGCNYSGLFKGIDKCNLDASAGLLRWENNWTTFLDSLLQVVVHQDNTNHLCLPVSIRRLTIDPPNHVKCLNGSKTFPFYADRRCGIIKSGAVEIFGVVTKSVKAHCHQAPVLSKHVFVPNMVALTLEESLRINIQIVVEKSLQSNIKAVEIFDDCNQVNTDLLLPRAHQIIEEMPLLTSDFIVSSKSNLGEYPGVTVKNVYLTRTQNLLLVVATKILEKPEVLKQVLTALSHDGFILAREGRGFQYKQIDYLEVITEHLTDNEKLLLLQKSTLTDTTKHVQMSWKNFNWLQLQDALKDKASVTLYSNSLEPEGILGLASSIRRESREANLTCFYMMDEAPDFDHQLRFYKKQSRKNFPINVFKDNKWGTYRYLPLNEEVSTSGFLCDKDKSYIIVGGLEEFGLELTDWLVANGATKMILVSNMGVQTGYQARKIRRWKSSGVAVVVSTKDIIKKEKYLQLIQEAINLGPVDAIFNLSVGEEDDFFEKSSDSLSPTASVASCLDEVTREYCQDLKYFVMFSSGHCKPYQNMANSFIDRLCEKRRDDGFQGLAIQWGPIQNVNLSSRSEMVNAQGLAPQQLSSCLDALDKFLNQTNPVVSSTVVAEKKTDNSEKKSILDRVAHVLGIKNIRNINTGTTLAEIGIDSIGGAQFLQILELDFGISMTLTEIRSLTIAKLVGIVEEIEKSTT